MLLLQGREMEDGGKGRGKIKLAGLRGKER
jgi:hypothetical protein